MALTKVTYTDLVTVIGAQNLNDIQDAIIALEEWQSEAGADIPQILADIAPSFSNSTSYSAGDCVIVLNKLYQFTAAHPAGNWTGTDATEVNVTSLLKEAVASLSGEVDDLKSALNATPDVSTFGWELGTLQPGSGAEQPSATRIRSDYVPVSVGTKLKLSGNEKCLIVYLFTKTKAYISDSSWDDGNVFNVSNPDAYYARVLIRKNTGNNTLYEQDIPTQIARLSFIYRLIDSYSFRREINDLESETANIENKIAMIAKSNLVFSLASKTVSGTAAWNGAYITLDTTPVRGETYYLHIDSVENCLTDVCARLEYRAGNKTYSYAQMTLGDVTNGDSISKLVDSDSITSIRITLYRNNSSSTTASGTTTFTGVTVTARHDGEVMIANEDLDLTENKDYLKLLNKSGYWGGKKIAWFGTSIPAGSYDDNASHKYPNIIGSILGATVYNEAVGSSSISRTIPSAIVANTNPYGFDTTDFEYAARCLTNTLEMQNWLIANYNSGFFVNNVPSSMGDSEQARIRGYSYENKVDRYLPGGTAGNVDLYVFDHGYNEYYHNRDVAALEATYGIDTTYCFDGGMNFLIRRILTANPDAKIVIISHYTDNATDSIHNTTEFVGKVRDAQKAVASRWGIKFINIFEKLGWSGQMITTTGYWDSDTHEWVNSGGTSQNIQIKDIHVRDTVHPYTDASGKSNNRIAEVIAAELNGLIR